MDRREQLSVLQASQGRNYVANGTPFEANYHQFKKREWDIMQYSILKPQILSTILPCLLYGNESIFELKKGI